jgi:hypothetical protein
MQTIRGTYRPINHHRIHITLPAKNIIIDPSRLIHPMNNNNNNNNNTPIPKDQKSIASKMILDIVIRPRR